MQGRVSRLSRKADKKGVLLRYDSYQSEISTLLTQVTNELTDN